MYGRGQLCKLNDSSINNEIHERQRRQDAPVRRRRLLVPHQGVEGTGARQGQLPDRTWRGSAGGISSGGSLQWNSGIPGQIFLGWSPSPRALLGSRKQRAGLGGHNPTPLFPSLPSGKPRREAAPPAEPPVWLFPCSSCPPFQCVAVMCQSNKPCVRDVREQTVCSLNQLRSRGENRNAARRGRSDYRE